MARRGGGGGGRSHSSGGGGRSHSSGGSWGRSHSSWGGSSHHHHHYYGGSGGYYSSSGPAGFSVCVFFAVFAIIIAITMFIGLMNTNQDLRWIEQDYKYYQSMIEDAKEDESLQVNARIDTILYNADYGKYYISYSYWVHFKNGGSSYKSQETFCIYDDDVFDKYNEGDNNYKIAISQNQDRYLEVDSINMDYEFTTLEDDGEYVKAQGSKTLFTCLGIAAVVVAISLFILNAVLANKKAKKTAESEQQITSETTMLGGTSTAKAEYKCKYCGCVLKEGEITCSKCGAPRK